MKIRRFLEKDSRTAIARARVELGADAVVLSNKSVGNGVELVAAVDLDEAALMAAQLMNLARRQGLAGSALARNQHRCGAQRGLDQRFFERLGGAAFADQVVATQRWPL